MVRRPADLAGRIAPALGGQPLSLVLDGVAGSNLADLVGSLRDGGTVVSYSSQTGESPVLPLPDLIYRRVSLRSFYIVEWEPSSTRRTSQWRSVVRTAHWYTCTTRTDERGYEDALETAEHVHGMRVESFREPSAGTRHRDGLQAPRHDARLRRLMIAHRYSRYPDPRPDLRGNRRNPRHQRAPTRKRKRRQKRSRNSNTRVRRGALGIALNRVPPGPTHRAEAPRARRFEQERHFGT
jgi:hypothetical protein